MVIGRKGSVSKDGVTIVYDENSEAIYEMKIPNYPEKTKIRKTRSGVWKAVCDGLPKETVNRLKQMEDFYYLTCDFLPYQDYCYVVDKFKTNCATKYKENPFFLTDITRENCETPLCSVPQINSNITLSTFSDRLQEMKYVIAYCLEKNEECGHTWISYEELEKSAINLLNNSKHPLRTGTVAAYLRYYEGEFYFEDLDDLYSSKVALRATYRREMSIYREVRYAVSLPCPLPRYNPTKEEDLSGEQNKAVRDLILRGGHFSILTGGPGTGKTTIIRTLVNKILLQYPDTKICLLAPTGKASKRIGEVFGGMEMKISTVHKFLGFGHGLYAKALMEIQHIDIVIVDESSMVDLSLFEKLLDTLNIERTKIIFVGDVDQLPSIGAGNVLCDLINLGVHTERLTENYRSQGSIAKNAKKINSGDFFLEEDDEFKVKLITPEISELLAGMDRNLDTIITPYKTSVRLGSAERINKIVQDRIFSTPAYNGFHVGDTVIMVKTNYKQGYFNGEVGTILSYTPTGDYYVGFGDRELLVKDVREMELGYAITVHKSQGSEYPKAGICISKYSDFITRRMLYTAITRAKESLTIWVDSYETIRKIVMNNPEEIRRTFLSMCKKVL